MVPTSALSLCSGGLLVVLPRRAFVTHLKCRPRAAAGTWSFSLTRLPRRSLGAILGVGKFSAAHLFGSLEVDELSLRGQSPTPLKVRDVGIPSRAYHTRDVQESRP